jgi:hypothetical protein
LSQYRTVKKQYGGTVMASKWMKGKEELFNQFKEQKKQEAEQVSAGPRRSDIV